MHEQTAENPEKPDRSSNGRRLPDAAPKAEKRTRWADAGGLRAPGPAGVRTLRWEFEDVGQGLPVRKSSLGSDVWLQERAGLVLPNANGYILALWLQVSSAEEPLGYTHGRKKTPLVAS